MAKKTHIKVTKPYTAHLNSSIMYLNYTILHERAISFYTYGIKITGPET